MKQVDFYLIKNSVKQARYKLASRLASKLQKMDKSLLLVTNSTSEVSELDELMWAYSDTSFVAHEVITKAELETENSLELACNTHIVEQQLVTTAILERHYDVLVNLCDDVPMFNHHFTRIAEVIDSDEDAKIAGRNRYKHYKNEGFELQMHDISL